jgi:hypothetical protein
LILTEGTRGAKGENGLGCVAILRNFLFGLLLSYWILLHNLVGSVQMNNEKPLNIMSWYFGMSAVLFQRIKARYSITEQDKYVCKTNLQHLDSRLLGKAILDISLPPPKPTTARLQPLSRL